MRRPDHHNEVELNLLDSGWVTYLLGGRKIQVEAGRLSVFWAAIPHQILEFGTKTEYYVATIPFAWFLQFQLPDIFVQPLLRGELLSEPTTEKHNLDTALFNQWEDDLRQKRKEMAQVVMLEMEARLKRMALKQPQTVRPALVQKPKARAVALHDGGLNKVEQMACLVAQRYTESLTVDQIGAEVGLHPNYAMSLFKKTFGTTLIDYLTHHRISHAQRLLATTDRKIVDIAFNSGFNSISRFNEAFRRACGCSPREYRLRHELAE
ncbi:MAG: helix-turn-helix domain-containing protein [Nibricoccus sp.]